METLGFSRKSGRHFVHPDCRYLVEFPPGPLAIGSAPVNAWGEVETPLGSIQILTPTQCVMDRLAAFYHWTDRQALDQAVMVALHRPVDHNEIRKWSDAEGYVERYEEFLGAVEAKKK